jgi:chorismate mutase/prephenate dehydratase
MEKKNLDSDLLPWRAKIDDLDQKLVDLLNERASAVIEIGKIKRNGDSSVYAPDREKQVLDRVRRLNHGPLPEQCLEAIWRELMGGCLTLERPLRIGYLGPAGSFSHMAARFQFGSCVGYVDQEDIASVMTELVRGHIDLGLVPIENSIVGGIGETLDAFIDSPVKVFAEVLINVHQNLLSISPIDKVRRVYSKPPVFSQCRHWMSANLRDVERISVASSSKAAEMARSEPGSAAVSSLLAGEIYGLNTLAANIEDNPNNITRFFVISMQKARPSGQDKTAIMFTTTHEPGALVNVLEVFRDHGLNLTHIDKRPSKRVNWEYYFFVDFLGHESDPLVAKAIETARSRCLQLNVLGSFPRANEAY